MTTGLRDLGLADTLLCSDMFWDLNKLDKLLHNLLYIFNAPNSTNEQVPNDIARLIDDLRKRPAECLREILSIELRHRTAKIMENFGVPCRDCKRRSAGTVCVCWSPRDNDKSPGCAKWCHGGLPCRFGKAD